MNGVESVSKPRVNGGMLSPLQGQSVCLLGIAKDVDTNGMTFTLTTSDQMEIKVTMREPLNEYVAGLTEVHGDVTGQNSLLCSNYVVFPEDASANFDMDLYNKAVETIARFPKQYITATAAS